MVSYRIDFLDVKDADAIVISYKKDDHSPRIIVVVDAGNISDSDKIKHHIFETYRTNVIDYAICTHPDIDHMGGFFGLLKDEDVTIDKFLFKDPCRYLHMSDFKRIRNEDEAIRRAIRAYNHPNFNEMNLIDLAVYNCEKVESVSDGFVLPDIPIQVVGPSEDFFRQVALAMLENEADMNEEPDFGKYDENVELDDSSSASVINVDNDMSVTNMASIMLLFTPGTDRYLLLGDATCASITEAMRKYDLSRCIIKVPHHGSRHNLNTDIIDNLKPISSVISAKGTRKHPNSGIVYWLSKYGDVYSTHKSGDLSSHPGPLVNPAEPLRRKMF